MNKILLFNLRGFRSIAQNVLLYRYQTISMLIIASGMLAILVMGILLFFRSPSAAELHTTSSARTLSTESIDELELWVEERHNAYEEGLTISGRQYFVEPSDVP